MCLEWPRSNKKVRVAGKCWGWEEWEKMVGVVMLACSSPNNHVSLSTVCGAVPRKQLPGQGQRFPPHLQSHVGHVTGSHQ